MGGQINSLSNLAAMARAAGDEAAAMTHTGRRLDITSALGEDPRHMDALADHAHDLMRRGAFQDARRRYGESLDMARRLGDLQGTLVASWGLADLAELEGDEEDAMLPCPVSSPRTWMQASPRLTCSGRGSMVSQEHD